jgi:hypothetical protein
MAAILPNDFARRLGDPRRELNFRVREADSRDEWHSGNG